MATKICGFDGMKPVYNNSRGGKDVTQAVLNSLRAPATSTQAASSIPPKN